MATLTVDRDPKHSDGKIVEGLVGADIIYAGGMVGIDTTSSGYLFDLNAAAADLKFAGVAMEYCDNSAGSGGEKSVRYWTEGEFDFVIGTTSQVAVGLPVYVLYNNTVTLTPGQYAIRVGVITRLISTTLVRVKIQPGFDNDAGVIPIGATAPLRLYVGKGAFTTSGVTVAVTTGGLTVVLHGSVTPVLDAGAAAANGQLSFTEDGSTGLPEVTTATVTVVRIAGTDSGLKFTYALWGY